VWKEGRYWCGEILKAEEKMATGTEGASGFVLESMKRQLYLGDGCCMPLFNSLREERFRSMTEAQREEYRSRQAGLIKISLSRSSAT